MTREEAIEVYNGLINVKIREAFEFFVPELRESEDEMMEKAIVDALLSHSNSINLLSERGYQIEDVKAYLEKQKEQKPNYCHYGGDPNIERCRCCSAACSGRLADEQKPPITGNDFGWIDELKHDLEHPEELDQKVDDVLKQRKGIKTLAWSEEDKHNLNSVVNLVHAITDGAWGSVIGVRLENWLKSLPERFSFQPKQEWSEEDLQHRSWILECLADGKKKMPEYAEDFRAAYKWFKSLRPPQYCENCKLKRSVEGWKPSEEQMKALNAVNCDGGISYVGQQNDLISLYNDLKKLM